MTTDTTADDPIAAFQRGDVDRARLLAERALQAQPENPSLQHLMGLIECRAGRLAEGIDWLTRAAEGDPHNVAFRVMLVRAMVDAGQPAEALAQAVEPAGKSPPEIALWHARAEAAVAAGEPEIAAGAWAQLADARPGDWKAISNLGEALAQLGRWDDAADVLGRALHIAPGEARVRRNYASALAHAGAYEESAAEYDRLVALHPDDHRARLTLARLLADLGRHEESLAQFEESARLASGSVAAAHGEQSLLEVALGSAALRNPDQFSQDDYEAIRELAMLLERTNRLDALRRLLAETDNAGISVAQFGYAAAAVALRDGDATEADRLLRADAVETDPVRWHRLMAKIQDDLGNVAAAFAEAEAMNRSVRDYDAWRAEGAQYRDGLRSLHDAIASDWPQKLPTAGDSDRAFPAFLVGFPRSGTTLADTFLMGHPATRVLEEVHMLGAAEAVLGSFRDLPSAGPEQLEHARQAYFSEMDRHVEPGFSGLVIDKLPLNMMGLPLIGALFPGARIVFAQRHPCDCVLSGFMQSFVLNPAMACFLDIEDAADLYDAAMNLYVRGRERAEVHVHTLVYEQLIADPESQLKAVLGFLGLEWDPSLLHHRETAAKRGAIITPSYDQVVQPLNSKPSGRWCRYEAQLEPILPALLPWAERLGYGQRP